MGGVATTGKEQALPSARMKTRQQPVWKHIYLLIRFFPFRLIFSVLSPVASFQRKTFSLVCELFEIRIIVSALVVAAPERFCSEKIFTRFIFFLPWQKILTRFFWQRAANC